MRQDGGDCMQPAAATAAALLPAGAPPSSGDVLWEIFLRLPPQPSSLVRVSFVCKRWRRLAADPDFLLRFRAQHRRKPPPLLGLFNEHGGWVTFTPLLDPPDRIPRHRFSMRIDYHGDTTDTHPYHGTLLGCRHGRLLVLDPRRRELLMCDPVTGEQRRVTLPPEFRALGAAKGAVICADDQRHHVHGGCHASPFKVVLVQVLCGGRACARVYSSSETGVWGGLILAPKQCRNACVYFYPPSTLVGNSLYWCSSSSPNVTMEILGFDVGTQSLSLIDGPRVQKVVDVVSWQIVRGDQDGGVGIAMLSYPSLRLWDRKVGFGGEAVTWVLRETVSLELVPDMRAMETEIVGYVEDYDAILIQFNTDVFIVQLESAQSKKLFESIVIHRYHSFTSFYSSGVFGRCRGLTSMPSAAVPVIPSPEQEA